VSKIYQKFNLDRFKEKLKIKRKFANLKDKAL